MTTTTCPGTPTPALPTVYACTDCGERTTERRCPDCNLFTTKIGPGGTCPSCDELITLADLADSNINNQPLLANRSRRVGRCHAIGPCCSR